MICNCTLICTLTCFSPNIWYIAGPLTNMIWDCTLIRTFVLWRASLFIWFIVLRWPVRGTWVVRNNRRWPLLFFFTWSRFYQMRIHSFAMLASRAHPPPFRASRHIFTNEFILHTKITQQKCTRANWIKDRRYHQKIYILGDPVLAMPPEVRPRPYLKKTPF